MALRREIQGGQIFDISQINSTMIPAIGSSYFNIAFFHEPAFEGVTKALAEVHAFLGRHPAVLVLRLYQ